MQVRMVVLLKHAPRSPTCSIYQLRPPNASSNQPEDFLNCSHELNRLRLYLNVLNGKRKSVASLLSCLLLKEYGLRTLRFCIC